MLLSQNTSKYVYFLIIFLAIQAIIVLFLIIPSVKIKIIPSQESIITDYFVHLSNKVEKPVFNLDLLPIKIEIADKINKQKEQNKYQKDSFLFFHPEQNYIFLLKKEDLKNFIIYKVNLSLKEDSFKKIGNKELVLDLEKDLTFWPENFKLNSLDLKINLETVIIQKFDILDLKSNIKGKKIDSALKILEEKIGQSGEVELKIFPKFITWVSWLEKRIKIEVIVDRSE